MQNLPENIAEKNDLCFFRVRICVLKSFPPTLSVTIPPGAVIGSFLESDEVASNGAGLLTPDQMSCFDSNDGRSLGSSSRESSGPFTVAGGSNDSALTLYDGSLVDFLELDELELVLSFL